MLPQTYTLPMQDEESFEQSHAVHWVDSPPVQVSSMGLLTQHKGARLIQPAPNANSTNSPGPRNMAEGRRCSESSTGERDHKVEMPTTSSPRCSQNGHATKNDATSGVRCSHGYESLVRWRREGKSYKNIKELGGFTEAESTLRGKFRTLTKSKKERPRRPEWTQRDIHLLNEAVAVLTGHLSSLRCTGKSSKIPWKKVAEYIAERGGYRFGNATCKKKWPLSGLVESKYNAAKSSDSLVFSSTELTELHLSGISFQLRYCPALANKPQRESAKPSKVPVKKPDPFDNPPEDLLIGEIPNKQPTHVLVLNKYPVIPQHFILATKINKQQTHLLEQDDLEATYACLMAWESEHGAGREKRLFAFFNSGEHSGASQAHRHIQFLPVEQMAKQHHNREPLIDEVLKSGVPAKSGSEELRALPKVPFTHFAAPIPVSPKPSHLFKLYTDLYEAAASAVRSYIGSHPGDLELHSEEGGAAPISYNLALTTAGMMICPRKKEGDLLRRDDGGEVGSVALNGTILAGTLMVKDEGEWELLKNDNGKLKELLRAVGVPQEYTTIDSIKL
ncbi:hypothetical protein B0A49_11006 [Cryomyces minteri]|uniref:Uncharacterized protein n=1 Tax=Cryomyces minteri TaxID=331657 RepID=A0A4V5NEC4_9PEZI|nr:hypothetical protein B0A49_11006 [Cryomyces minteri]